MGPSKIRMKKEHIIITVLLLILATAIVSLTIGRELVAGKQPGLTSFSIVHFAGSLFFLLMPVELLVPYYLAEGHNAIILIGLAVATGLVALIIDYALGHLMSHGIIHHVIGHKRMQKARAKVHNYGNLAIFFFNLFPLSSPIVVFAAGTVRHSFGHMILYSFAGLFLKYTAIVIFFGWL